MGDIRERVEGKINEATGRADQELGNLPNNPNRSARGEAREVVGHLQNDIAGVEAAHNRGERDIEEEEAQPAR